MRPAAPRTTFRSRLPAIDVAILLLVPCARVLIDHLRHTDFPLLDLPTYFVPNFAWWWHRARWLGGWNPWVFGGYPANADPEIGQLHPFGLLYAVLPPLSAVKLEYVLAPAIAALGMRTYLRCIGCGRAAAMVGALSFAGGGFVAANAVQPSLQRTAMALPWVLAAIEGSSGAALTTGVALASALLFTAGHPQEMVYALLLVIADAAWLGRPREQRRGIGLVMGLALGAGLAAAGWLPALELIRLSDRGAGIVDPNDPYRLSLSGLVDLIVPFAHGGNIGSFYGGPHPSRGSCGDIECAGYPGMLAWLAVLAGVPFLVKTVRGRFWLTISVLGLLAATWGSPLLSPQGYGMRASSRFLLWWNVAIAVLAALSLDTLVSCREDPSNTLSRRRDAHARDAPAAPRSIGAAWLLAGMAIGGLLLWARTTSPTAAGASLTSLEMLSLSGLAVLAARRFPGAIGRWCLIGVIATDVIAYSSSLPLETNAAPYADSSTGGVLALVRDGKASQPDASDPLDRSIATPSLRGAAWSAFERIPLLQGYSSLVPMSFARLIGGPTPSWLTEIGWVLDGSLAAPKSHVLDLLRCRLVVVHPHVPPGDPLGDALERQVRAHSLRWAEFDGGARGVRYYVNRRSLPVAWLVPAIRILSPAEVLREIRGGVGVRPFDPEREALSDRPIPGLETGHPRRLRVNDWHPSPVKVEDYGEDEIRLHAETAAPTLLVTSELAYPGWTARIDRESADVHQVNAGFRSVVVPAGSHEVTFEYRPPLSRIGCAISLTSLLLLGVGWLRGRRGGVWWRWLGESAIAVQWHGIRSGSGWKACRTCTAYSTCILPSVCGSSFLQ